MKSSYPADSRGHAAGGILSDLANGLCTLVDHEERIRRNLTLLSESFPNSTAVLGIKAGEWKTYSSDIPHHLEALESIVHSHYYALTGENSSQRSAWTMGPMGHIGIFTHRPVRSVPLPLASLSKFVTCCFITSMSSNRTYSGCDNKPLSPGLAEARRLVR